MALNFLERSSTEPKSLSMALARSPEGGSKSYMSIQTKGAQRRQVYAELLALPWVESDFARKCYDSHALHKHCQAGLSLVSEHNADAFCLNFDEPSNLPPPLNLMSC